MDREPDRISENLWIQLHPRIRGLRYLVKNFTEDDIYIGFTAGEDKTARALVPAETAQVFESQMITGDTMYVLPVATSEKGVEVQCLRW